VKKVKVWQRFTEAADVVNAHQLRAKRWPGARADRAMKFLELIMRALQEFLGVPGRATRELLA
jgi:hypothetical protein